MAVVPVQIPVSTTVPALTLAAGSAGGVGIANSIDAVNDYLLIYTASATATQGINRNTLLGLSSAPLGTTDAQNPTNKTFNNTNSYTTKDGSYTLQNTADTTKQGKFSLSGNTTGTTRTYTLPDYTATLATLGGTETLLAKTLTSPTINSPTITNATISSDAVTGFSISNTGVIYGLSVTTGTISAAGLASNSVTQPKLSLSGNVTTYSNPGGGTGTFYYINLGGIKWLWGAFTGVATGGAGTLTLPVGFFSTLQSVTATPGVISGTTQVYVSINSASTVSIAFNLIAIAGSGTMPIQVNIIGT